MTNEIVKPVKEFRIKCIKAAIWKREKKSDDGRVYDECSVTITKSYKPDGQDWQETTTFFVNDLPALAVVSAAAYKYIMLRETE